MILFSIPVNCKVLSKVNSLDWKLFVEFPILKAKTVDGLLNS